MPEFKGRLRTPRLPSAPASPITGEMYYDTTTNILYWWNGTAWTAAAGGGAMDLRYNGAWAPGTYTDGDIVIYNGVEYMAVRTTTQTPAPWTSGTVQGVPTPVVNGQWLKGAGGIPVWTAINGADIAGYPADQSKALMGDATWQNVVRVLNNAATYKIQFGGNGSVAFPAGAGTIVSVNLTTPWPNAHFATFCNVWPLAHWGFSYQSCLVNGLGAFNIAVSQTGGAQNMALNWVSFGN